MNLLRSAWTPIVASLPAPLAVDGALKDVDVRPIRTPVRASKANAHCERFIGTIRGVSGLFDSNPPPALAPNPEGIRVTIVADARIQH